MFNKKALGMHWFLLLFGIATGLGVIVSFQFTANIPKIGELSLDTIESIEGKATMPLIVEGILKEANKQSIANFDNHKIFTSIRSYCENGAYRNSLPGKSFADVGQVISKGRNINCLVGEDDLMLFFEEAFEGEYEIYNDKDFSYINLTLSSTTYDSTIIKEADKYYNILKTDNGIKFPILTEKGGNGYFIMKPSFRLNVDYPFDDPSKEVCILSRDCGATCNDVVDKYGYEYAFKIQELSCDAYYACSEAAYAKDNFGNYYACDYDKDGDEDYLCTGQCIPFCSKNDLNLAEDDVDETKCRAFSCGSYMDCSAIDPIVNCGCNDDSNPTYPYACEGSDCDTLHCEKDQNPLTQCKDECSKYGDCSSTLLCACDSSLSACEGACYCNQAPYYGNCGENGCSGTSKPQYMGYEPSTCHETEFLGCSECEPECDECGCNYGSACGPCGLDPCPPPEPAPTPPPTPTPTPPSPPTPTPIPTPSPPPTIPKDCGNNLDIVFVDYTCEFSSCDAFGTEDTTRACLDVTKQCCYRYFSTETECVTGNCCGDGYNNDLLMDINIDCEDSDCDGQTCAAGKICSGGSCI